MISVLIPTYNYNISQLVNKIHEQFSLVKNISFEILVYDDGSNLFQQENSTISTLKNTSYTILEKNIGRSAIRNLLAKKAIYENLLFLDADVEIVSANFITNYIYFIKKNKNYQVCYGGIIYQNNKPSKNQLLRWKYGKKREALVAKDRILKEHVSFLTLNFLINKNVFKQVSFNEKIPNLRYEDLLFSYDLMQANIPINHIDNVVVHNGIETSELFLKKTNDSLFGLKYLLDNNYLPNNYSFLTMTYYKLKKVHLLFIIRFFYKISYPFLTKNILGKQPNLLIYDFYRLGYFSNLFK